MRRALALAQKARGRTNPNPLVGALIVKGGRVVGEGYHRALGKPHAEIEALRRAGTASKGATLYVTLEPCRHFGRTPPCVSAISAAGIKRVVFASRDPVPGHGGGARILRGTGVETQGGILARDADILNEAFMTARKKHRPFIAVKFASSLDGKIATRTGDSKWISSKAARAFTRALRAEYQAILVGIGTVLADDPHLGARRKRMPDPLRIILDSHLRIPLKSRVLRDKNVLVVGSMRARHGARRALESRGIPHLLMDGAAIDIPRLARELYRRGIISILVEGGGSVLGSFLDAKLIDKVYAAHAPLVIGGAAAASAFKGRGAGNIRDALHLRDVSREQHGDTLVTIGYPKL